MRGRHVFFVLLGIAVAAVSSAAELDPPSPSLGTVATLTLEEAPADSTEMPTSRGALLRATEDPRRFEVVPVRVGEIAIAFGAERDTLRFVVPATIESADPTSLRPLASVGEIGPNWWPTVLLVLALLAPLVWVVWRLLRGRRGRRPVFELPVEPAHVTALRRLDEIEAERWPEKGEFDRFFVEASRALRAYIGGRFLVPALDWTREETVRRLVAAGHDAGMIDAVDPLLGAADEVKFARRAKSVHQAEQWLAAARMWIEETKVEPVHSTPEAILAARRFNGQGGER